MANIPDGLSKVIEGGIEYTVVEKFNGTARWWYKGDKLHRELGPAIECPNGDVWWYYEGLIHRLDGPAVSDRNGETLGWYYKDEWINVNSQQEFERLLRLKAFW